MGLHNASASDMQPNKQISKERKLASNVNYLASMEYRHKARSNYAFQNQKMQSSIKEVIKQVGNRFPVKSKPFLGLNLLSPAESPSCKHSELGPKT